MGKTPETKIVINQSITSAAAETEENPVKLPGKTISSIVLVRELRATVREYSDERIVCSQAAKSSLREQRSQELDIICTSKNQTKVHALSVQVMLTADGSTQPWQRNARVGALTKRPLFELLDIFLHCGIQGRFAKENK